MKKKITPRTVVHAANHDSQNDELRRHFQISLEEIRAGKGISDEESLRQLEEDLPEGEEPILERDGGAKYGGPFAAEVPAGLSQRLKQSIEEGMSGHVISEEELFALLNDDD
jgi:hypothetical protein